MIGREEWRGVPGWPEYEVSNFGNVRRAGRNIKPWRLKNGRWQVKFYRGKARQAFHTYRLVALAFLGPEPFPGAEVAHRDDNKNNNSLDNLHWRTHRENCADRLKNGCAATGQRNGAHTKPHRRPRGERAGGAKLTRKAVAEIRSSTASSGELAARFCVSRTTVGNVRRGDTWKSP